ncbi:hypothetical protein C7375_1633 [Frischella perrara]|uniref:Uncharacterized protein n=1 Tax=Frischella perrara TaxID=1267021 RepID=A0A0A7S1M9_FRIPE|nr:hypothetical protein [Frischella perrara]AJA44762.1 hypothetical protein FPB0191_00936 [Frischella perrara]PWV54970.1 hypothetical protein C7375_1633 [Frischella perrara]
MTKEDQILNQLGGILINSAPAKARKLIMHAEPNAEGDVCKYKFYYVNKRNEQHDYDPDGIAEIDILDTLVELRKYYLDNNLSNGEPIWVGCIVEVDVKKSKINIEFKYEPFIFDE